MKMKSIFFPGAIPMVLLMMMVQPANADGLLTNTNQGTKYVRMLSRNASTQVDAVYFNPAGLTALDDGWHFAINDHAVFQKYSISSGYPVLTEGVYAGKMTALFNPSAFMVFKTGNLAFSLGVGTATGGGTLRYDSGLPFFEIPLSRQAPDLTILSQLPFPSPVFNVTAYDADINYETSSSYTGIQAGVTYRYNEVLSLFAGVRCTPATNNFRGVIQEGQLMVNGEMVAASGWLTGTALPLATTHRNTTTNSATTLQSLITIGAGSYTLAQVQGAGYISSATRAILESNLSKYAGLSSAQIASLNINQALSRFNNATTIFNSAISRINAASNIMGDKKLESEQNGIGWTPILGVNVNVNEKLNAGIRYEFRTKLDMTNGTVTDDFGLYPDGAVVSADIPALFSLGIGYRPIEKVEAQLSFDLFFDMSVYWGQNFRDMHRVWPHTLREREVVSNTWQLALGLQYNITENFAFSVGGMTTRPGVAESFQSEFGYASPSITLGGGIQWKITDALTLDAGIMNSFYRDVDITYSDVKLQDWNVRYPSVYSGPEFVSGEYSETMGRKRLVCSIGLAYRIFK